MRWRTILFQLNNLLADQYLAAHENDFTRFMIGKISAHPAAGDAKLAMENEAKGLPAAINLVEMANEYRAVKGILTHEEHCKQLAKDRLLKQHGMA